MNNAFYIMGAGGHAKVVVEIIEEMGGTIVEVNDSDPGKSALLEDPVTHRKPPVGSTVLIAVGNNRLRKKIVEEINGAFGIAIHPRAHLSSRSVIAVGTAIMAGATINSGARIGRHCIINANASVDHDCFLADFVHLSPGASLAGGVIVGEGAHIGIGSTVVQGIHVGQWATVGAGAAIVEDVPDFAVVVGVPGRILKYNRD